jgi:hypothetical protein
MADTLTRAAARGRGPSSHGRAKDAGAEDPAPRPTALVGIAIALWTVALGLAFLVCLTLAAWVTAAHHDDAIRPAIATAIQAWLLAQHGSIVLGGSSGSISIVPLGLTFVLGVLLVRAGRRAARLAGAHDLLDAGTTALAVALPYAVVAALLTSPARLGHARPAPLQALVGGFTLAPVCTGVGVLRETGQLTRLLARVPARPRLVVRAGFAASAIVAGGAAVALALAMVAHAGRAAALTASMHGGYSSAALMAVISMAYTPNAVAWGSALALGPGFSVGAHTSVTLIGVHLGAVPALPLLAPLPGSGSSPLLAWLMLAAPVTAGVVGGWLIARSQPVGARTGATGGAPDLPWWARYRLAESAWGVGVGVVAAVVLGAFAWASAGSLGGARMSVLGPSLWWVVLAAALEIGGVASATIWVCHWQGIGDRAE